MTGRLQISLGDRCWETGIGGDILASYAGTGLHGVSQIAHEGLVLSVIAAGQLSEALAEAQKQHPSLIPSVFLVLSADKDQLFRYSFGRF